MPAADIIAEREHRHGRFADGEGGCDRYRWEQALEPLSGLGQLGGEARRAGVDLSPDVVSDEAHDAFAVVRRETLARVSSSRRTGDRPRAGRPG